MYTEKKAKLVSKVSMKFILGFVGKTHVPKMCRAFDLTSFGAFLSLVRPTKVVLILKTN